MSTLMESWPRRHRITVDEYHRMGEVGLLAPDARHGIPEVRIVDLRNGELRFYRSAEDGRYLVQDATKAPGVVRLAALPDVEVDLSRILSGPPGRRSAAIMPACCAFSPTCSIH